MSGSGRHWRFWYFLGILIVGGSLGAIHVALVRVLRVSIEASVVLLVSVGLFLIPFLVRLMRARHQIYMGRAMRPSNETEIDIGAVVIRLSVLILVGSVASAFCVSGIMRGESVLQSTALGGVAIACAYLMSPIVMKLMQRMLE